jgi:hypothetical protein
MKKNSIKIISIGEFFTLLGVICSVMSAAYPWAREAPVILPGVGAIYISDKPHLITGYDLHLYAISVGWAVVICAVMCGGFLLFNPTPKEKNLIFGAEMFLSLVILALGAYHIGPFAGAITAMIGAGFLIIGAALRKIQKNEPYQSPASS